MADSVQTYKNHVRWFPPFHFFAAPLLLLNVIYTIVVAYRAPTFATLFGILVALAILVGLVASRLQALVVQDRLIRLEMRLRLRGVLPPDLHARIGELTREQMVALRFAGDEELADLVREVLAGRLSAQKDIKLRVRNWQGDYLRA